MSNTEVTKSTSTSEDTKEKKKLSLPEGAFTELPEDYKSLDPLLLDEVLNAADLGSLSPLGDDRSKTKIDWQSLGTKNDIEMYWAQTSTSANYFFKGVGIVPCSPKMLEDAIRVPENMKIMDPMCLSTKTIKTFDRDHHIYSARFKLGFMIWDRDFAWYCLDTNLSDGTYVSTGKSIVTTDYPEVSGCVRGEIRASGYIVQPIKDKTDECRVIYLVQTDPKGWLPSNIVNYVASSQAYNPGVIKEKVPIFLEMKKKEDESKSSSKDKDSTSDDSKKS